jgi:hypothetical protein
VKSLELVLVLLRDPEARPQVPDEGGNLVIGGFARRRILLKEGGSQTLCSPAFSRKDPPTRVSDVPHLHSGNDHATFVKLNRSASSFNIAEDLLAAQASPDLGEIHANSGF